MNSFGMKFVYIEPGNLLIKNIAVDSEHREVRIKDINKTIHGFYLQTTEVTVGQWKKFASSGSYTNNGANSGCLVRVGTRLGIDPESNWSYPGYKVDDYYPVSCVSWDDANQFAKWLSEVDKCHYRLPIAAEWEYACKAVNGASMADDYTMFSAVTNKKFLENRAWFNDNSGNRVHIIAQKQDNKFGLFDMIGNVNEWCIDSFDLFVGTEFDNITFISDFPRGGLSINMKIKSVRGCGFDSHQMTCNCERGFGLNYDTRTYDLGFRLVKELQ